MRKKIITSMLLITILTACNTQTPYKQEIENKKQEEIEIKQSESNRKNEKVSKQSENKTPVEDKKKTPKIKDTDNKKSVKTKKKENIKSDKDNKNTDDKNKSDKLKDNKTENKKTIKEDKPSNNKNKTSNTDYKETTYTSDNSNTSKENTYTYKETPNKETNTEIQIQPKPEKKAPTKKKTHTSKKADNTPKVMTVTTERETIPAEHIKIYKTEWTPAEAPKYPDRRKDGYYEYEVTTYSDGTQTRKLINTVNPVNYTEFIGIREKLKESTIEWDGTFRPNQLIYKNRERIFTILPYHDYDNGMTVINNNEVAAYGNTADVNDNESTYYAGHFDSVFKDIREEGQTGDEIIITDEYGQTAYYRISDIFYYSVGSQVNGTPTEYYYKSGGKEQIQIQTCKDATQSTYIIYTADKM